MRKQLAVTAGFGLALFCVIFIAIGLIGCAKNTTVATPVNYSGKTETRKKPTPDRFAEIKRFVKDKYQISNDNIKYIFALNFDDDSEKEYAVFFEKKMTVPVIDDIRGEYNVEETYNDNIIIELKSGSFRVEYENTEGSDVNLVGVKCRDFDRDGKDELLIKAHCNQWEYDILHLIEIEGGRKTDSGASHYHDEGISDSFRILDSLFNSDSTTLRMKLTNRQKEIARDGKESLHRLR